jgi:polar amino acid transport system substrate-binding protein
MARLHLISLVLLVLINGTSMAQDRPLTVNYALGAEHYSYEEHGTMRGTLVELTRTVLQDMGLASNHRGYPWRRAQHMVYAGQADALCTVPTPERKKHMLFSREPVLTTRISVIYGTANPKADKIARISSLDELVDYRIVDHMGDQWAENTLAPRFDIHWARTIREAMFLLGENRYDLMVASRPEIDKPLDESMVRYGLTSSYVGNLHGPAFHFGLRKNYPQALKIMDDFDQSVRRLRKSGRLQAVTVRTMF